MPNSATLSIISFQDITGPEEHVDQLPIEGSVDEHLRARGHTVASANTAEEVLETLSTELEIDLLILDWIVLNEAALALCRQARELKRERYLHIVILTSREEENDLQAAIGAGADILVEKDDLFTGLEHSLLTVRRQASVYQDLREQCIEAQYQSRLKSEFLANMTHEIRTPMNGVLGLAHLLASTNLNSEQEEQVEMIKLCGENLLSLISDVLDISRMDAGREEQLLDRINFPEFVSNSLAPLSVQAANKGLPLIARIKAGKHENIVIDTGKVRQLLSNLVGNAIKFTEKGMIRVDAVLAHDAQRLTITVEDTGSGIAEDRQEAIFEPFTQENTSTDSRIQGSGLGLSISRRLTKFLGGQLSLEKSDDKGSIFKLDIPFQLGKGESSLELLPELAEEIDEVGVIVNTIYSKELDLVLEGLDFDSTELEEPELGDKLSDLAPTVAFVQTNHLTVEATEAIYDAFMNEPTLSKTKVVSFPRSKIAERLGDRNVTLRLPVTDYSVLKSLERIMSRAAQPKSSADVASNRPLQILVAEDNPINLRVMTMLLEKQGHTVIPARTGKEAFQMVIESSLDLILMDVQMPEGNGYDITRKIRARELSLSLKRLPIFALTARAAASDRTDALESGMDSFLEKPLDLDKLNALLATVK